MHVRSDVSTGNLAGHVAQARGVKIDQAFVSLLLVGFTSGKRVFPHLKFPDLRTSKLSRSHEWNLRAAAVTTRAISCESVLTTSALRLITAVAA